MSFQDFIQLGLFIGILIFLTKPLGLFMGKVFSGEKHFLIRFFGRFEKWIYRICHIEQTHDQTWVKYATDLIVFSAISLLGTYAILRLQNLLPLNPQHFSLMSPDLAFNTSMSFTSNTNWQAYGGESTLSYISQMVGLTIHNFLSAAVGIIAAVAVIRGIASRGKGGLGNFWVDLVRCNLYILLPMSFFYAIFLISQGVIQNFSPYIEATTLEGGKQIIAMGPAASQIAIKMLGTNGGGFFNANAAHPFENPTALSNFIQMLSIFLIPSALVYLLGHMCKNLKHAWSVWSAMTLIFLAGVFITAHYEYQGVHKLVELGCSSPINLEGKETRFGIFNSALFANITTDASCGAVNSMHDSFTPLGGLIPLVNILLGELIFGGVGSGLYGMVLYIILTVFIAGLMVGRTPEYLGKRIEGKEVKYAMLSLIVMALSILGFSAWASIDARGVAGILNPGPHGFSEMFYAYTSATGNNGSAFGGLTVNTPFWNITLAFAMFFGRFFMMIPMLALAGSLAGKRLHPESDGSFPVHGATFVLLLIGVILIVGALTFFPALSLGPIVEHFEMLKGKTF